MIPHKPSRNERRQVKTAIVKWFHENNRPLPENIKKMDVDDILDLMFSVTDCVSLTLKDGRRIAILPNKQKLH